MWSIWSSRSLRKWQRQEGHVDLLPCLVLVPRNGSSNQPVKDTLPVSGEGKAILSPERGNWESRNRYTQILLNQPTTPWLLLDHSVPKAPIHWSCQFFTNVLLPCHKGIKITYWCSFSCEGFRSHVEIEWKVCASFLQGLNKTFGYGQSGAIGKSFQIET